MAGVKLGSALMAMGTVVWLSSSSLAADLARRPSLSSDSDLAKRLAARRVKRTSDPGYPDQHVGHSHGGYEHTSHGYRTSKTTVDVQYGKPKYTYAYKEYPLGHSGPVYDQDATYVYPAAVGHYYQHKTGGYSGYGGEKGGYGYGYGQGHEGHEQHHSGYEAKQGGYEQSHGGYEHRGEGYEQKQGGYQQYHSGYGQSHGGYEQHGAGYESEPQGYDQHHDGYYEVKHGSYPAYGDGQDSYAHGGNGGGHPYYDGYAPQTRGYYP